MEAALRRAHGIARIFTFKEGLLSRVAHDLELRLSNVSATLAGDRVSVTLPLDSLRVVGVIRDGRLRDADLDPSQRAEIERAARDDVLDAQHFPSVSYEGNARATARGFTVEGALTLRGQSAPQRVDVTSEGGQHVAVLELLLSRYRIPKYKALMGAIRLQDRVRIEVELDER